MGEYPIMDSFELENDEQTWSFFVERGGIFVIKAEDRRIYRFLDTT